MKETIYTIPVNDAFAEGSECPVCSLEKNLERANLDYVMGAALMEPGERVKMNEKGFCKEHYARMLDSQKNALGLSLVLTSHHEEFFGTLEKTLKKLAEAVASDNRKQKTKAAEKLSAELLSALSKDSSACFICDRVSFTMDKYIDVIFFMWKSDPAFRSRMLSSKGFCNRHLKTLLEQAGTKLKGDDFADFIGDVYSLFIANWKRNEEDLRWFTKKFDYRFKDEPWKESKDALSRFIQKLTGFLDQVFQK